MKCRVMLLLVLPYVTSYTRGDAVVRASCTSDAVTCEFDLVMTYNTTMTLYPEGPWNEAYPVRVSQNGTFYRRDLHVCSLYTELTEEEEATLVSVDGYDKMALLYNGSLPGPSLVVYEGQQVVVRLRNYLDNEVTSLHFHGIAQRNTPWMDGAGGISHCPINPGETFTYRFRAEPVGTYWYHSHSGTQRTMGAFGAFIVLPRDKASEDTIRGSDPLPEFAEDYVMTVTDWMEMNSLQILELVQREAVSYMDGYDIPDMACFNSTKQSDGVDCGVVPFNSGLINGKGRKYYEGSYTPVRYVPLEVFHVRKGRKYRFRVICASMTFGFRISVDGHPLSIISADGRDVVTRTVQSLVVHSGERFDFWISATDPDDLGSYWIRAETLERYQNNEEISFHHVEAVLQYGEGVRVGADPVSTRPLCTAHDPCQVINCPFRYFAPKENISCLPITELTSTMDEKTTEPEVPEDFLEFFLNFHFVKKVNEKWQPTINGIQHSPPKAPPQVYPDESHQAITPCDPEKCLDSYCYCTHGLDIPLDKVVQIVLAITITNQNNGILNGMTHPIHFHGYGFQVIKMAFPSYNNETGFYESANSDLDCVEGSHYCNQVKWRNASWDGGNVPGVIQKGAPLKDTVIVPVGGYVIIRFKADNPGFWYAHCHTEFHNEEGMALYMQVGDISEMPPTPSNMNSCGNFDFSEEEYLKPFKNETEPPAAGSDDPVVACQRDVEAQQWVIFALAAFCTAMIFVTFTIVCNARRSNGYTAIETELK